MRIPVTISEEVGMRLLLLPILLFDDFTIFNDFILFSPKVEFCPQYIRYLLWNLRYVTGHYFYIKKSIGDNTLRLYCSEQPHFFRRLLQNY